MIFVLKFAYESSCMCLAHVHIFISWMDILAFYWIVLSMTALLFLLCVVILRCSWPRAMDVNGWLFVVFFPQILEVSNSFVTSRILTPRPFWYHDKLKTVNISCRFLANGAEKWPRSSFQFC